MAQQILKNNCYGVLSQGIDAATSNLSLLDTTAWPALSNGDWCLATLIGLNENGQESAWEVVKITSKVNNTLTAARGQEGSAARAWPAGTVLQMRLTAASVATPSLVDAVRAALQVVIDGKVSAVAGMGLSSNNYTNDERVKLANIQTAATKNLPDATLLARSNHTGGFNGFGNVNDMRNGSALPASSPPSAFIGKGSIVGLAIGPEIGIPALAYGIYRCDAQWNDVSADWGVMRSFESDGHRFVCAAISSNAWSPWKETTPISQLIDSANWSDFILQMWNLGPGYYRSNTVGVAQTYSAGFFSKTADTWTYLSAGHSSGVPLFMSGMYSDIAAGTWKTFTFGTASPRDVQTAASDDTAGRVMTVGAFGLGGNALPLAGDVDINTANLRSGLYYSNGAKSGPGYAAGVGGYYGWIRVEDITPGQYTFQTAFDVNGRKWHRHRYAGNWQPWVPVYDGRSVVATVDSVTHGGVIEYGSNANGTYTKFVGGLLVCRKSAALNFTNQSNLGGSWIYPSAFIDIPFVTGNVLQKNSAVLGAIKLFAVQAYSLSTSDAYVGCLSPGNFVSGDETKGDMQLFAIGKWK